MLIITSSKKFYFVLLKRNGIGLAFYNDICKFDDLCVTLQGNFMPLVLLE